MIDNLIDDPIKEIWINLELNFERYEFFNFLRFFHIFWIFLNLKPIYFDLKSIFYCAGDMAASGASDRVINRDCWSSLKARVHGVILFVGESFSNDLITAIDLRSYNGWD